MPDIPQTFSDLLAADEDNLDRARDWVMGHFTEVADEKYAPIDGKLRVIDAILSEGWIDPGETAKLQSLGAAFGDAIAQRLLMEWVVVEDEYGRSPALRWPGTTVICSPLTMISKRIEDGEIVDVYELFDGICTRLREMAFSARYV
jgi:hypothetical protein